MTSLNPRQWPPEPHKQPEGRLAELELARMTFEEFQGDLRALGAKEYTDTTSLARALQDNELIVRREDPDSVMHLLEKKVPLAVAPYADGVRYANCAVWDIRSPAGLNNAFLEGYAAKHYVVAVMGFTQTPDMDILKLDESADLFAGMDRTKVRSFGGEITPDNVRFVLLRVPLEALQESQMTDAEIERYDAQLEKRAAGKNEPEFAYRGYILPSSFN